MLRELFGRTVVTAQERDLLDTIRESAIPSPAALRERLASLNQQIETTEAEWERLGRRGDAAAFLALTPVAERLEQLRAQAAPLPTEIAVAERRRASFLTLGRLFHALAADVSARTQVFLEHPPQDPRERDRQLHALDQATRIHGHLAARLSAMSTSRQFREPPDALRLLRNACTDRIRELDRLRLPGMKPALVWPPQMIELLEVTEDRPLRKETA